MHLSMHRDQLTCSDESHNRRREHDPPDLSASILLSYCRASSRTGHAPGWNLMQHLDMLHKAKQLNKPPISHVPVSFAAPDNILILWLWLFATL